MKYSNNRIIPSGVSKSSLEESLGIIVDFFTEEWLNEKGEHPLKKLWERNDVIATTELFTFGRSILSIKDLDKNWIKKSVRRIKEGNANNVIGYVFEIIAAAMINKGENQELTLPPSDNPAIDLIVNLDDGSKVNISCKKYGLSDREKFFNRNAEELEDLFIKICKKYGKNRIQCIIQSRKHVEEKEWHILKSEIEFMVASFNGEDLHYICADTWYVAVVPLLEGKIKFADGFLTYTFMVISPHYKFERDRLYKKLEKACHDLDKCQIKQDENEINIVFVHLPEAASLNACYKWGQEFLEENLDKPVAGIFFIQNVIVRKDKKNFILVNVQTPVNSHYELWEGKGLPKRVLQLKVIIAGQIGGAKRQVSLMNCGVKVPSDASYFDERYIYQKGKHYIEFKCEEDTIKVRSEHFASGIHEYAVVVEEKRKVLIAPPFSPDDKLILI